MRTPRWKRDQWLEMGDRIKGGFVFEGVRQT